ncbi:MAG TPA: methylated-DNA--[protein]-cysteine S-methyltransferase [Pirellulaceae bacterium]|nr:methylated-DNA--[protein]-cysteine S-methyltransferase [Pirellulaceae bacterium]
MTLALFPSEIGWMAAVFSGATLVRLSFGHPSREKALSTMRAFVAQPARSLNPTVQRTIESLQAFAAGQGDDLLDIEVDYGPVTAFQQRVLDCCRAIAPGETLTYGELAKQAGAPGAARAVGSVMRRNKLPLVIPCHRVVASGGSLGGYTSPQGLKMKLRLLEREGAELVK